MSLPAWAESLKKPDAQREFAALFVDAALAQKVGEVTSLPRVVEFLLESLRASAARPETDQAWVDLITAVREAAKQAVPASPHLEQAALQVVGHPHAIDRSTFLTVFDRPPVREMVRTILTASLIEFGKRASAPVAGMAKTLGGFAKLGLDAAKASSGSIGGILGAVSGEVERQLEKRAREFADLALSKVIGEIADVFSNPARTGEAAAFRTEALRGAFSVSSSAWSRELDKIPVREDARLWREALLAALGEADAAARATRIIEPLWTRAKDATFGELLATWGYQAQVRDAVVNLGAHVLGATVESDAFAKFAGRIS